MPRFHHPIRLRSVAGGVALAAAVAGVQAGPLDPSIVDPTSKWVVHANLEAARASKVGTYIESISAAESTEIIAQMEAQFGIDPSKDILGVTVFGGDPGSHDGVAVIEMSAAADRLATTLPAAGFEGFETLDLGSIDASGKATAAWHWMKDGRNWYVASLHRDAGHRMVLLAPTSTRLQSAVEFARNRSGSVGVVSSSSPAQGSILFVAARGLEDCPKFQPDAAVLKLANSFTFDLREVEATATTNSTLDANVHVDTRTPEEAVQIQQMLQGVLAFTTLTAGSDPDLTKLMKSWTSSITMSTDANTFSLKMSHSTAELIRMFDSMRARIDAKNGPTTTPATKSDPSPPPP